MLLLANEGGKQYREVGKWKQHKIEQNEINRNNGGNGEPYPSTSIWPNQAQGWLPNHLQAAKARSSDKC